MSDNEELREQLVGAWELISYIVHSEQTPSTTLYPLGKDAKGIIMYTHDGYMSAQLQRPGQVAFSAAHPVDGTEDELAESARNYVGYTGPFHLDDDGPETIVLHHFLISSFPNWLGDTQRRKVKIEGDQLIISLEASVDIKVRHYDILETSTNNIEVGRAVESNSSMASSAE